MAHLITITSSVRIRCDACDQRAPTRAKSELLSYEREHTGYYCVAHSERALQTLRDREAQALLRPPLPLSIIDRVAPPTVQGT